MWRSFGRIEGERHQDNHDRKEVGMRRLLMLGFYVMATTILAGFTLDNAIVPKEEILSGGPPKDGIPALLKPKFIQADQ